MSVRLDSDGDDADVYAVNDLAYRDVSGPAPWQAADAASEDDVSLDATGTVIDVRADD